MYDKPELTKSYLLSKITHEQIYWTYTGSYPEYNKLIKSPLRKDSHPTATIYIKSDGGLWFEDWSGHFRGDVFDIVKYFNPLLDNFYQVLAKVAVDHDIPFKGDQHWKKTKEIHIPENINVRKEKKGFEEIKIKSRDWNIADRDYWVPYGISKELLGLYNVYAVRYAWYGKNLIYTYKATDPCYAYHLGNCRFQLYFPMRTKDDKFPRFITNNNLMLGWDQLPEMGEYMVITKSMKDIISMRAFDIPATGPQGESTFIKEPIIKELQHRFNYVFSLYDFDLTGIRASNKLKKEYGVIPLFLFNGRFGSSDYIEKDFADFRKKFGEEKTRELITITRELFDIEEYPY